MLERGYHHPNRELPEGLNPKTIGILRKKGFIVKYDDKVWILTDAGARYVEKFD